jgi:rod shape-determining protein MreC
MDNLISRHRNVSILVAVLFAQVLGLAVQVKRSGSGEDTRLIRIWAVEVVTPVEKAVAWVQNSTGGVFHNYVYLRGVRAENRQLKQQIEDMRLQQVRLTEDAEQARRLQLLLGFKEKFIEKTVPAQVIGTSGTDQSRSIYIDKGWSDGVKPDQAVITADGIVGKILHVYDDHTANLLLVNDASSGVGVILEKSRLQGILRGTATGQLAVEKIMDDEAVQPGERVLTSGGDQIFPKGLEVGLVTAVKPGKDSFLDIRVRPSANLGKLEEVLVITQVEQKSPTLQTAGPVRAVDILTQRLPSVPDKPPADAKAGGQGAGGRGAGTPRAPGSASQAASSAPTRTQGATGPITGTASVPAHTTAPQAAGTPGMNNPAGPQVKPKTASAAGATTTPKPGNDVNTTGVASGQSATPPISPAGTRSPKPVQQGGAPATRSANGGTVGSDSATVKPTSSSGSAGTAVKPALAQSPQPKKAASSSANPPDKSTAPATATKPQTTPAEDKPE